MPDAEFNFINDTFSALAGREERHGAASITDIERVVLIVWHASGIVENGGFRYFFECGLSLRDTAEAYTRIGVDAVAVILHRVHDLFPGRHIPDDWDERMEIVEQLYDKHRDLFDRLESEFYRADEKMQPQLAGWIRVHKDVFGPTKAV